MAEIQMHFSSGADASKRIPIPAYCQSTAAAAARQFHQGLPGYQPTPLHEVKGLAQLAAVGQVWVKDEAGRFDLDAFKVLGASYAVARLLAHELQLDDAAGLSLAELAAQAQQQLGQLTLVTATDGNHGRAVAWAAQQLGQQAVVYLPQGAAASRVMAIEQLGAQAVVTDSNYDDAVRLAAQQAEANGWFLVQDTAGPGYTQIPTWIMQGYTTLAAEAWQQLQVQGVRPTHIFLQAGVGSMAAAVLGYFMDVLDEWPPKVVIMEPERAACYYQSARRGDGLPHAVIGDLQTIMAGLSCGEPNPLAWPLIRDHASAFASCSDGVAALGMRILGHPMPGDARIVAGESGAVGAGLLAFLSQPDYRAWRQQLQLNEDAVVLIINTEGATDPVNYRAIVWGGQHPVDWF